MKFMPNGLCEIKLSEIYINFNYIESSSFTGRFCGMARGIKCSCICCLNYLSSLHSCGLFSRTKLILKYCDFVISRYMRFKILALLLTLVKKLFFDSWFLYLCTWSFSLEDSTYTHTNNYLCCSMKYY